MGIIVSMKLIFDIFTVHFLSFLLGTLKIFVFSDLSFPRLGQMIVDYEQPVRRLADEFVPHTKLLSGALRSLWPVYVQRNLTADQWR